MKTVIAVRVRVQYCQILYISKRTVLKATQGPLSSTIEPKSSLPKMPQVSPKIIKIFFLTQICLAFVDNMCILLGVFIANLNFQTPQLVLEQQYIINYVLSTIF